MKVDLNQAIESTLTVCRNEWKYVAEVVTASLEYQRVRRCLDSLTELQRESIKLAYYRGYSYPQVAQLLGVALGTVKTRIRDGLIRMRDCMEVTW